MNCGNSTLVAGEVCISTGRTCDVLDASYVDHRPCNGSPSQVRYLNHDSDTGWSCSPGEAALFCASEGYSNARVVYPTGVSDYVYSYCAGTGGDVYAGHLAPNHVVQREVACSN
jgi:hypothetical protein